MEGISSTNSNFSAQNANTDVPKGAPAGFDPANPPKFKEVWEKIQSEYGAKPQKPREIKKTLDKDDFMKIMITEMKHQDPTKPYDAEKMAQQLAQITSVEQLNNMGNSLKKMTSRNQPIERLTSTNMIGKYVMVDRNRFPHESGQTAPLSFSLPEAASEVKMSILNDRGEVVAEKTLSDRAAGKNEYTWDGLAKTGLPAQSGMLMVRFQARAKDGHPIEVKSQLFGKIEGVNFTGPEPTFLVGNGKSQQKITLDNIVKIDSNPILEEAAASLNPFAQMGAGANADQLASSLNSLSDEMKSKIQSDQMRLQNEKKSVDEETGMRPMTGQPSQPQMSPQMSAAMAAPTGFPNGLSEGNETTQLNDQGGEAKL
jgi:flagellar basal-body rod modification protein FlgD